MRYFARQHSYDPTTGVCIMNIKKLAVAFGLGLSLACAAGTSSAQQTLSFEDDDIDFVLRDGVIVTSGPLMVGDVFVSIFEIPKFTINGVNALPDGSELTGVAASEITDISGNIVTFAASSDGLNSFLALGTLDPTVGVVGDAGGGATIAMWLDSSPDLEVNRTVNVASNCANITDCIDRATDGTLFQVDGFAGDPDEIWRATATTAGLDIGLMSIAGSATPVAIVSIAQTTFFNATGPISFQNVLTQAACADTVGCVAGPVGSATITGGSGLVNGAVAHSDFDFDKLQAVPEPGVLALLGIGLFGLAGIRRRSQM
jgi:hypothetical protein